MITNDTELNALMNESIRPKCTPRIQVQYIDENNNDLRRVFTEDNITSLTYKRGIDPIGRTLPYMELVWTETNVEGTIEENEPKSDDFKSLSLVSFDLTQYLDFGGEKKSYITMNSLYLVGTPVVNGNEIVWTARDMMYFLNTNQEIGFQSGLKFTNPLRYFLLDERAEHKVNKYWEGFIRDLSLIQTYLKANDTEDPLGTVIYQGETKNLLKDIVSTRNYFWDFSYAVDMELKSFSDLLNQTEVVHTFHGNTMKKFPELTKNSNISAFNFVQHRVDIKTKETYTIDTPTEVVEEMGATANRFEFSDWGIVTATNTNSGFVPNTINKSVYTLNNDTKITVAPVSIINEDLFVNNNKVGETYSENNTCYFKENNTKLEERMALLNRYFNDNVYTMQFEGLPHFAIEPCDLVGVETDLTRNGETVVKKGVVIEQELSYNGAWEQKMTVHEVK